MPIFVDGFMETRPNMPAPFLPNPLAFSRGADAQPAVLLDVPAQRGGAAAAAAAPSRCSKIKVFSVPRF